MNINRAMNIYMANNTRASKSIRLIAEWREKDTLKENYDRLNINPGHALNFAKMYKLAYQPNTARYCIKKGVK